MNKAIGIIETIGMIPAVTALDIALKSANVELKEFNIVRAGIVTVIIEGDVASVKSAVDAGVSAVSNIINNSVTAHVIPRPIDNINIAISSFKFNNSKIKELISSNNIDDFNVKETKSKDEKKLVVQTSESIKPIQKTEESVKPYIVTTPKYTKESLMAMNTSDIREICKGISHLDLSTSKLKKMKKEELINIVLKEIKD